LFSIALSMYTSLNVRVQVWNSYKTTGKIIGLYILNCIGLENKQDDLWFSRRWLWRVPSSGIKEPSSYLTGNKWRLR
jgi:hypothetical protein